MDVVRRIKAVLTADASQMDGELKKTAKTIESLGDASQKSERLFSQAWEINSGKKGALTQLSNSIRENGAAWDEVSNKSMIAGGAIAAGLGLATKAAIDWESAFAGVKKTVDDTEEGYAALEQELRDMAEVLPATQAEIAGVAEAAGQLGVQRENITSFTRVMIDLGESTNLSAEEAATGLARFANVMGTSLGDVDRLGSVIVGLGNNFATTEREILEMSSRLSGAGRQARITEAEVLGIATALSSVGIEAEAGGTAFSRVMIEIGKSVDTSNDKLAAFARVAGLTAEEFQNLWRDNAGEGIQRFIAGLGELQARGESLEPVLSELGMTDIRVGDALRRSAASSDVFTRAMQMGNEEWEKNNALTEEAAKRYETAEAQLAMARNQITNAAIDAGAVLAPVLVDIANLIANAAGAFADLPGPIQEGSVWLAALGSAALLAFGGTVKAVKGAQELHDALTKVGMSASSATGYLKGLGAAAGGLAVAYAAVQLDQWSRDAMSAATDVAALTDEMDDFAEGAVLGWGRVESQFARMFGRRGPTIGGWSLFREELVTTEDALASFADKASREYMDASVWDKLWSNVGAGSTDLPVIIGKIDESLAQLVATGRDAEAERIFGMFMDSLDPDLVERVAADFVQYGSAIEGVTGAAEGSVDAQSLLAGGLVATATASAEAAEELEEAKEAFQKWRNEIASSDAAFISLLGAYDEVIAKNKEVAEASAEATKSSKDSWEDFYDGQTVSIEDYLTALESMVEAQLAWETNMIQLSGRVSQGVIDELARLGPEGAPLVADLVEASDAELARLEAVYSERATGATDAFALNLRLAGPVLAAIMGQAGTDAAAEAAASLAAGEKTIQQVIDQYDLDFDVDADTGQAVNRIDKLYRDYNNGKITIRVVSDTSSFVVPRGGGRVAFADGGVLDKRGLAAFANGGAFATAQPQIRPYSGPRGVLWGEEGSGPWEAFISGHPAKKARSRTIADDVVARLGGRVEWIAAYANGGIRETGPTFDYDRLARSFPTAGAAPQSTSYPVHIQNYYGGGSGVDIRREAEAYRRTRSLG